jgi:hypothetical protein
MLDINLADDYVWRQSGKLEDGKFRPLRKLGKPASSVLFLLVAGSIVSRSCDDAGQSHGQQTEGEECNDPGNDRHFKA